MRVAVLREVRPAEHRVALIPSSIPPLEEGGFSVVVESGAGERAGFTDDAYREAGAEVAPSLEAALDGAEAVLKVTPPLGADDEGRDEIGALPTGSVLVTFLRPLDQPEPLRDLARRGVTAFSMELVPRVTRAQKMDALSSQATTAGYRAALLGATNLGRFLPMLMTAAGTIPPAKAFVLGAGVAGLQAIATCRRLGASVFAFDVRPAVKEQVESLGARFVEAELEEDAEAEGGYARALSDEEHEAELQLIGRHIPDMDLVITTAQIPGRPAPLLVTEEMVRSMRPGSVVVDLAAGSGGNCELSEPDATVERHGVRILGPTNLPSELATHASQMYGRNVSALLLHLVREGRLDPDFEDEIVDGSCVTHGGEIRNERVIEALGAQGTTSGSPPAAGDEAAEGAGGEAPDRNDEARQREETSDG